MHYIICYNFIALGGSKVTEGSKVSLEGVANLLGLAVTDLERSLTSRVMTTTKGGTVGTIIKWVRINKKHAQKL